MSSSKISEYDLDDSVFNGLAQEESIQNISSKIDNLNIKLDEVGSNGSNISHGSVEFTTAGSHTWICPEGVYWVYALLQSAGGGGGGGVTDNSRGAGGGGAAGNSCYCLIPVTPNTTYSLTVGDGGAADGVSAGGTAARGGTTSFSNFINLIGGAGGVGGSGTYSSNRYGTGGSNESNIIAIFNSIDYTKIRVLGVAIGESGATPMYDGQGGQGGQNAMLLPYTNFLPVSPGGNGGGYKGSPDYKATAGSKGSVGKISLMW